MPRVRSSEGVRVAGLDDLNKALKALGGREFQSELRDAGKDIAGTVAGDARSIALSLGGVQAKVAPSIRAAAGFTSAGVGFGGAAYPFAGGAEFGSLRYSQFPAWKGNGPGAGYFIYEAIRDNVAEIEDRYLGAVDDILRRHDLK